MLWAKMLLFKKLTKISSLPAETFGQQHDTLTSQYTSGLSATSLIARLLYDVALLHIQQHSHKLSSLPFIMSPSETIAYLVWTGSARLPFTTELIALSKCN